MDITGIALFHPSERGQPGSHRERGKLTDCILVDGTGHVPLRWRAIGTLKNHLIST